MRFRKNPNEIRWEDLDQEFKEDKEIIPPEAIQDVDRNTRLPELDAHWLKISEKLNYWRYVASVTSHSRRRSDYGHYRPMLLIHGYKSSHTTWNWLVQKLWQDGFHNIFAMELYDYQKGLKINCEHLAKIIKEILTELVINFKQLDIIGHSMGGIVGRYFTKFFDVNSQVRVLITMGSAHTGLSRMVTLLLRLEGGKETARDLIAQGGPLEQMNKIMTQQDLYSVTMINMGGALLRYRGSDGFVKIPILSDMVNITVPSSHRNLNKSFKPYRIIHRLMMRSFWIYKTRLLYINPDNKFPNREYIFKVSSDRNKTVVYPSEEDPIKTGTIPFTPEFPIIIFCGHGKKSRGTRLYIEVKQRSKGEKNYKKLFKKRVIIRYKGKEKDQIQNIELKKRKKVAIQLAIYKYFI